MGIAALKRRLAEKSALLLANMVESGKTARVYVDANHGGDLDAGDMLIQLTGVAKNALTASSFAF